MLRCDGRSVAPRDARKPSTWSPAVTRVLRILSSIALLALTLTGCSGRAGGGGSAALGSESGAVAGLRWRVPRDWSSGGDRPMRVATYAIPSTGGGSDAAECAVFYFGSDQGGAVESNLQRWVDQFEAGARTKRSSGVVNGLQVTRIEIDGAYLSPAGPQMQSQGAKPGFRLLGAIVEGPAGLVFFKSVGPQRAMGDARAAFDAMIGSVRKG